MISSFNKSLRNSTIRSSATFGFHNFSIILTALVLNIVLKSAFWTNIPTLLYKSLIWLCLWINSFLSWLIKKGTDPHCLACYYCTTTVHWLVKHSIPAFLLITGKQINICFFHIFFTLFVDIEPKNIFRYLNPDY